MCELLGHHLCRTPVLHCHGPGGGTEPYQLLRPDLACMAPKPTAAALSLLRARWTRRIKGSAVHWSSLWAGGDVRRFALQYPAAGQHPRQTARRLRGAAALDHPARRVCGRSSCQSRKTPASHHPLGEWVLANPCAEAAAGRATSTVTVTRLRRFSQNENLVQDGRHALQRPACPANGWSWISP